jgi:hypothetical protein
MNEEPFVRPTNVEVARQIVAYWRKSQPGLYTSLRETGYLAEQALVRAQETVEYAEAMPKLWPGVYANESRAWAAAMRRVAFDID